MGIGKGEERGRQQGWAEVQERLEDRRNKGAGFWRGKRHVELSQKRAENIENSRKRGGIGKLHPKGSIKGEEVRFVEEQEEKKFASKKSQSLSSSGRGEKGKGERKKKNR